MPLASRRPTGLPAVPIVLVKGPSKSGRTVATAKLSLSPWVDRFFVVQIGTQAWDDYGAYFPKVEILDHTGTVSSVLDQIDAACEVKAAPGKLNVIVVDDATEHWDTHKVLAETRQRRNERTRKALAADADAEVDPTMDKWNDVKARWARMFHEMKRTNVVGIFVARADTVAKVDGSGNPVANQTEESVQAEKTTTSRCTMVVTVRPDHAVILEAVTSLQPEVIAALRQAGRAGLVLPDENPIGHAIDLVSTGRAGWGDGAGLVTGQGDTHPVIHAKQWVAESIRAAVPALADDPQALRLAGASIWEAVWKDSVPPSGAELTAAQKDRLDRLVPDLIRDRLLAPGVPFTPPAPIGEAPDDSDPEPHVPTDGPTVCPECHRAAHLGACPPATPPASAPAPPAVPETTPAERAEQRARRQVGARAHATEQQFPPADITEAE